MSFAQKLEFALYLIPILIVSATLHELAHAYTADRLGDSTARKLGRLTLNPIKHLDPIGSASFLITYLLFSFPIGWAKPVPVYPSNLKIDPRRGMAIVAAAGPLSNFLIAAVMIAVQVHLWDLSNAGFRTVGVFALALQINIVLGVFNLLPVPPLDGSRIIGVFMSKRTYADWMKLDQFAPLFLLLIFLVFQGPVFSFVSHGTTWVSELLYKLVGG